MKITVLTTKEVSTFCVDQSLTPAQIRRLIAARHGYQSIGVPHSWVAAAN